MEASPTTMRTPRAPCVRCPPFDPHLRGSLVHGLTRAVQAGVPKSSGSRGLVLPADARGRSWEAHPRSGAGGSCGAALRLHGSGRRRRSRGGRRDAAVVGGRAVVREPADAYGDRRPATIPTGPAPSRRTCFRSRWPPARSSTSSSSCGSSARICAGSRCRSRASEDPQPPWTFRSIHMHFVLTGTVDGHKGRAIDLAESKYCRSRPRSDPSSGPPIRTRSSRREPSRSEPARDGNGGGCAREPFAAEGNHRRAAEPRDRPRRSLEGRVLGL